MWFECSECGGHVHRVSAPAVCPECGVAGAIFTPADPDDLLVLGNRGRERLAGHVTGSWTRAVLDRMPCDVMLVPL